VRAVGIEAAGDIIADSTQALERQNPEFRMLRQQPASTDFVFLFF
jgi:hypothetical protein